MRCGGKGGLGGWATCFVGLLTPSIPMSCIDAAAVSNDAGSVAPLGFCCCSSGRIGGGATAAAARAAASISAAVMGFGVGRPAGMDPADASWGALLATNLAAGCCFSARLVAFGGAVVFLGSVRQLFEKAARESSEAEGAGFSRLVRSCCRSVRCCATGCEGGRAAPACSLARAAWRAACAGMLAVAPSPSVAARPASRVSSPPSPGGKAELA